MPDIRVDDAEDRALRKAYPQWGRMARAALLYLAGRKDLVDETDLDWAEKKVTKAK